MTNKTVTRMRRSSRRDNEANERRKRDKERRQRRRRDNMDVDWDGEFNFGGYNDARGY